MKHVTLSKEHTVTLDNSARRTFPAGWSGSVDDDIWADIKKHKVGDLTADLRKKAAADAKKKAPKKPTAAEKQAAELKVAQDAVTEAEGAHSDAETALKADPENQELKDVATAAATALDEARDKLAELSK